VGIVNAQPADAEQQVDAAALAAALENAPPGLLVKGSFSVYKTDEGGLHLAFRLAGAEEDGHVPVPAGIVRLALSAASGKGPLGMIMRGAAG
jgi:hypothetical protein